MARHCNFTLLLVATITLWLTGCTRNNGDIGIWFGTWHVTSITADGAAVNYEGDYFFQFQTTVFRVSRVTDHEESVESFGTWSEDEDASTLTVNFVDPDVYYLYVPGFDTVNAFHVTRMSSSQVTFTRTADDGVTYVYSLKKQP